MKDFLPDDELRRMVEEMEDESSSLVVPDFSKDPMPTYREMIDAGFVRRGSRRFGDHMLRDVFVRTLGFALPCREAIEECVRRGPLVEVGAGPGLWASIVARNGGDVVATDRLPTGAPSGHGFVVGSVHPVEAMTGPEAVRLHPDRTVLMIWPSLGWSWAAETLDAMAPGQTIVHVGEIGECTGDRRFAQLLSSDAFEHLDAMPIPNWPGMNDCLDVYRKR